MNLGTRYSPEQIEKKWYERWVEKGYFAPKGSGIPFVIVIPPPNITGRIHMGHALNITLQDILVRYKRMRGFDTLWVPGEDHAGIATQNAVERYLESQGKSREQLGREKFIEIVWEWAKKYRKEIRQQIETLGASVDWSRERFTLDDGLSKAVRKVFVDLYNRGLIYRGKYMVNWCPRCQTVLSDEEVEHIEESAKLYYVKYPFSGSNEYIVIATTRPETMLGDVAVAVNPEDERYKNISGKTVVLPLMNREIPIITDSYVDPEFGTGAVKITPAHDPNDFDIAKRHSLQFIEIFDNEAKINENGGKYAGLDRYQARKAVLEDLEKAGFLLKVENINHAVGHCYRCDSVIEPRIMDQWFVSMKSLSKRAIEAVENEEIRFVPERWKKVYLHWMYNIRDWCISRQLWWGHRVPVWYCKNCNETIVSEIDIEECPKCGSKSIEQDEDVLDTWFSSALWPFSTLGWPEKTEDLEKYYPTSVLVTGFDIIFFWVARMIIMGYQFMQKKPFTDVYIHQLIRDKHGRKMSKSLGNGIDPIDMSEKYGTDPVRFTLAIFAAQGSDIKLDERYFDTYRKFANKIWNAARFVLINLDNYKPQPLNELSLADRWILSKLQKVISVVSDAIEKYEFNIAARSLYEFFWNEFCDWYIESSKLVLNSEKKAITQNVLVKVLDTSLRLLHPFMPFLSEELWQNLPVHGESIVISDWPEVDVTLINEEAEKNFEKLVQIIRGIRNVKAEMNIPPKRNTKVYIYGETLCKEESSYIEHLSGAQISYVKEKPACCATAFVSENQHVYVDVAGLNLQSEIKRLMKNIEKLQKEREWQLKKLSDDKFLSNAPEEAISEARQKLSEIEDRLKILNQILGDLM
ncbi:MULTISPECIES: valine--tRNA ligase [Pseudothermotoga]|jgi:valyl-tRNA synthetase|uniref:Valine--tRNA ligase n=1 Tax=Pseudothermotoga lettingae (strain ATCC BAA-301 / DSM 14385 / NBRC 107922 / TMO) TaxID=416591 RepID=SYV_PSELT|nr:MULTISPECIES: valine--tRNA ligase [Pseudothermotoga]A8F8Q3.1 RecName: Full=Valine--tRNA ligase; AltName: Full=Valyl-tRNA synthetase; Short=ValRS [Pseudothermotoga lettingae TMO]ABV34537.1 valyl-tRNA synthetase [Pseudothermotoga lettingae TMO]KUK20880.1 MAG: Valine--tRNA ligase [Pseudothermotoga lettingae]MDI3494605.1 valyl-tRNA synthetase [Pseudothermotoga sp.]MDK2883518.1 valyl-tRNA synthetase [Pseudothermotoga sp.]GLI48517.1 valine--tRNA ligase [Pseudothermotoga lettingae TMO]